MMLGKGEPWHTKEEVITPELKETSHPLRYAITTPCTYRGVIWGGGLGAVPPKEKEKKRKTEKKKEKKEKKKRKKKEGNYE